ncbi:hypothetical protein ACFQDN_10260 [Pseudomonas asuensis]|jgi:hypothetical protein|uniref:Uncharacterized protein n=1 Tax=Pseudomonas asuensis TaxID=1825787 RepID=A0ABQ2GN74_9PSED|nr:hypothetical protein [Pseudomonas asuensis]GGM03682.1 hypothetical protein GCM10009425_13710 [Pseudomonas asuensis]
MYQEFNELWLLFIQALAWTTYYLQLGFLLCAVGIVVGLVKWSVWWGKTLVVCSIGVAALLALALDAIGKLVANL